MSRYSFLFPPFDKPVSVTKCECKYCKVITYTKGSDLDTTRCNNCGSVAYGCIEETRVSVHTVKHKTTIHGWCVERFSIWNPNNQ